MQECGRQLLGNMMDLAIHLDEVAKFRRIVSPYVGKSRERRSIV